MSTGRKMKDAANIMHYKNSNQGYLLVRFLTLIFSESERRSTTTVESKMEHEEDIERYRHRCQIKKNQTVSV